MKNLNKLAVLGLAATALTFTACQDNMLGDRELGYPEQNLSRLFTPGEFTDVTGVTDGYRIEWVAVDDRAEGYIFQFCEDSLFNEGSEEYYAGHPNASRTVLSDTLHSAATLDTITGLGLEKEYFIRVSAFATGIEQSHWLTTTRTYKTLARELPQVLKAVDRNDVYEDQATICWNVDMLAQYPMDQLIYSVSGEGNEQVVSLDAATQQAGQYTLTGLMEGTSYTVRGHNSAIEGEWGDYNSVAFRTKSGQGDAVIYDGSDFNAFLEALPNNSTVFIPAGTTVTCQGTEGANNVLISKDVTIRGESDAALGKPVLSIKEFRLYGALNLVAFENVVFDAGDTGGSYVVNLRDDAAAGLKFEGCELLSFVDCEFTGYANSIIRHQATEGTGLGTIEMDNCYVHDFNTGGSGYALFMFKNADYYVGKFNFSNCTFFNVGTNIIEHRITDSVVHNCDVTITDCTFQNCGKNTRYMFDFDKTTTGTVNIQNCIFGAVMDPASHKGYRASYVTTNIVNCYAADDFTFASSPGVLANIPTLGAPAADIFVDAAAGNLSLTGVAAQYAGKIGDPRWY